MLVEDRRWEKVGLAMVALALIVLLPLLELAAANQDHGLSRRAMLGNGLKVFAYAAAAAAVLRLIAFRVALWQVLAALVPVIFFFFSYGTLNSLLRVDALVQAADQSSQAMLRILLLGCWVIALALVFWLGLRMFRTLKAVRALMVVVALLVLVPATRLLFHASSAEQGESLTHPVVPPGTAAAGRLPNIYWLVADGYPRADVLREDFGFDNSEFQRSLERMGFVLPEAAANYPITYLSVASMASMDYIVDETTPAQTVRDVKRFIRMVGGDNELVRQLRGKGYRYVHFTSGYEQSTLCSGVEDLCILGSADSIDEIGLVLLRRTPLLDLGLAILPVNAKVSRLMPFSWRGFDALEDHLPEVRRQREPIFLYAHILDPHPPLRHNADCSIRPAAPELMQWSPGQRPAFVAEIECVNRQLSRVLASILEADPEAVIVVNGDHGSAFRQQFGKPMAGWTADDVRERLASLLAMHVPVACRERAARITSLVNVFRVVSGCLSGAEMPLLPARHFVTPYNDDPNFGVVLPVSAAASSRLQ